MGSKFGFLMKLEFLQDWASALIARINPAVVHNLEKYQMLKKVHYLSSIEGVAGDYLEFGVFTGSSFCHSLRCSKALLKLNPAMDTTVFYGFDSFNGFGELRENDKHPFYTDENFATSLAAVDQRAKRVAGPFRYKLVPGFFNKSLRDGASVLGIEKSRIIFIDSDTFSSAAEALAFCAPTLQQGTFIVLDDYFSYRGSLERGVAGAFSEFLARSEVSVRQVLTYGLGGAVFVVSGMPA